MNLSVLFGVVCLTLERKIVMASKQQQAFKMCVRPCPRYLTGGDTHILCVACLGEEQAQSALESVDKNISWKKIEEFGRQV